MNSASPSVAEYEIFKNERNALAFFFEKHPLLDKNAAEGPFWFYMHDNKISAGTETHHVVFENIDDNVMSIARKRGVIMLIEFENQQPARCTPCYLSNTL